MRENFQETTIDTWVEDTVFYRLSKDRVSYILEARKGSSIEGVWILFDEKRASYWQEDVDDDTSLEGAMLYDADDKPPRPRNHKEFLEKYGPKEECGMIVDSELRATLDSFGKTFPCEVSPLSRNREMETEEPEKVIGDIFSGMRNNMYKAASLLEKLVSLVENQTPGNVLC